MPDNNRQGAEVVLAGVEKSFGANTVLSRLDLTIRAGQFLSIVGKSGCGKSTLLRLLTGLDAPSRGEVLVDGAPVADQLGSIRLMFQEPRLLPWASVIDNVSLGLPGGGPRAHGGTSPRPRCTRCSCRAKQGTGSQACRADNASE
ncbi:ATP-binding cassette domain-containing protein [Gemmobacter sp. 24YEA27]|uniref:ATP-binding cassette domain-containing protein n=1 Tax=Gemmobacter sp. 24YEA27 TaxID=3040672 RepID=UPI0032C45192